MKRIIVSHVVSCFGCSYLNSFHDCDNGNNQWNCMAWGMTTDNLPPLEEKSILEDWFKNQCKFGSIDEKDE